MSIEAFRGTNGWYTASVNEDGSHRQPENGGLYESKEAAIAAESPEPGTWVDYDGTIYDEETGGRIGRV